MNDNDQELLSSKCTQVTIANIRTGLLSSIEFATYSPRLKELSLFESHESSESESSELFPGKKSSSPLSSLERKNKISKNVEVRAA